MRQWKTSRPLNHRPLTATPFIVVNAKGRAPKSLDVRPCVGSFLIASGIFSNCRSTASDVGAAPTGIDER